MKMGQQPLGEKHTACKDYILGDDNLVEKTAGKGTQHLLLFRALKNSFEIIALEKNVKRE